MSDNTPIRPNFNVEPSQLGMDEKVPMSPSEPPSPPRAYNPHEVERASSSGYQTPREPLTAVNSISLEAGMSDKAKEARESTLEPDNEPEIPAAELPLVVRPFSAKMRQHLMAEVDIEIASFPLGAYCFMTGYSNAITYTAAYVWSSFQTGNTIQCAMSIAKTFSKYPHAIVPEPTTFPEEVKWNPLAAEQWAWHRDYSLKASDAQPLVSLLCFLFGAFCGRLGDRIGPRKRVWLMSGTFLQAAFSIASGLCAWGAHQSSFADARGGDFTNWGNPLGFCAIGFASAAMGLQAHAGVRIGNIFNSTVVLTTIWVQLVGEPKLFQPHMVKQRDHKIIAILGLLIGGIVGRALVDAIGAPWTLGLGAGIRILIAFSWLSIPAAKPKAK